MFENLCGTPIIFEPTKRVLEAVRISKQMLPPFVERVTTEEGLQWRSKRLEGKMNQALSNRPRPNSPLIVISADNVKMIITRIEFSVLLSLVIFRVCAKVLKSN